MPKFKVRVIYQYTHEVEVEAEDSSEAKDLSTNEVSDDNRIHDDHWYDSEIIEEIKEEDE